MKNLKVAGLLFFALGAQNAFSQSNAHLTLSDQHPAAGEKLTLSYDPSGTAIDGKTDITASVYFLDGKKYPVADVNLAAQSKTLSGSFSVPDNTKAFFVRISSGKDVDNNGDKGYVYMIYKDGKPVEGAYAMNALVYLQTIENYYAKVKTDNAEGTRLFNKEMELYPNGDKDYPYLFYTSIVRSADYKDAAVKKIAELEKSTNEEDLNLAATMLSMLKQKKSADSLDDIIRQKFPNGSFVKNKLGSAFYSEKDPAKKDSLYQVYVAKYPEDKTAQSTIQDNFRMQLAVAYLNSGDMKNFRLWDSRVKDKSQLQGQLNNVAYEWAKKGEHMDDALAISKESLDIVNDEINNGQSMAFFSPDAVKKNNQYAYDMNADTYAFVLAKEKKFSEALKYEQPVIDHSKTVDPDVYGNYINILVGNGMDDKAQAAAETALKAGQGTVAIKELLKKGYVKVHGNDTGFNEYVAALEKAAKDKALEAIAKTMINQPAHDFTLKDLDGKTVSLADLKGKIVIVDFWATWCGPCKASFPGMQMAVNKYKDDPNVKFLFVDTWETGDNYADGVKKFIEDNKYTFHVLLDEKNSEGRQAKVVTEYGVDGIPTKFIIDKDGNIRFKYIGYTGTPEKLVDEVTEMIDMANKAGSIGAVSVSGDTKSGSGK